MEDVNLIEELKSIKNMITPMTALIQEFHDLKRKSKISENSSISLIKLLTIVIKEDVMNDVALLNQSTKTSIYDIETSIETNQREVINKFEVFEGNLVAFDSITTQLNEAVTHVKGLLTSFYDKFDQIRSELDEKSSKDDLNEISKKLKLFAFQKDLESLESEITSKASRESITKADKKMRKIEENIQNCVDKSNLEDIKKSIKFDVEAFVELNCLLREEFGNFKDVYSAQKSKNDDDFKGLVNRIETHNKFIKDSIVKTQQKLAKKPWTKETLKISQSLENYSKKTEFRTLEEAVYPMISNTNKKIEQFTLKILEFEKIVQRYDEILLEKASKDDLKYIQTQLPLFTLLDDFTKSKDKTNSKLKQMDLDIESLTSFTKTLEEISSSLSTRLEHIKKENREAANISSMLSGLKEQISEKADKIDFHKLLDSMGNKEEVFRILEKLELFQKQIELGSILNQTLCRTMLSSGESYTTIVKQRNDIYRKMTGLVS